MLKLSTANLLNPELIWDYPKKFKFMQVHENEEYQAIILAKESKHVLFLLHTRDTKNNKRKENSIFPTLIITFKT